MSEDLSEYEKARLLQIEKNKALLASLNIAEITATMVTPKRDKPVKERKRKFKEFADNGGEVTRRRSARVAGMPASSVPSAEELVVVEKEDKRRLRREGDFTMESAESESGHAAMFKTLRDITFATPPPLSTSPAPKKAKTITKEEPTPKRVSPRRKPQPEKVKDEDEDEDEDADEEDEDKENKENKDNNSKQTKGKAKAKASLESAGGSTYKLKKFEITAMNDIKNYRKLAVASVTKAVPDRIYNIAIHPSRDRIVIAAGDTWGRIGLWDYGTIDEEITENNTCVYKPHCAPVGGLQFSPSDSSKLFSASYDGTVRCADLSTGMFTQLHMKDATRTCLDSDPTSSSILFVGGGDGVLTIIDTRTPKVTEHEVHQKKMHAVSVHPLNPSTVATGSTDQTVCIWDIRKMKTAVHLFQHQQAVTSCAFSKKTGKYLVSCSYDNHIRIWEDLKLKATIDHNCTTGRWITPFKLAWDPKNDSVFACGNMHRSFDIFNAASHSAIVQLADPETLTAIPSINQFHQYHNVAVSATASGRTYVWK